MNKLDEYKAIAWEENKKDSLVWEQLHNYEIPKKMNSYQRKKLKNEFQKIIDSQPTNRFILDEYNPIFDRKFLELKNTNLFKFYCVFLIFG